jgi:hypothetical protein
VLLLLAASLVLIVVTLPPDAASSETAGADVSASSAEPSEAKSSFRHNFLRSSSMFSKASTPEEVMSGDGVIVSGRKSRPASCKANLVRRNGFGFSQRNGSADSQALISARP